MADQTRDPGWQEIHGFTSPDEFRRFQQWITEAIAEGALIEVAVNARYNDSDIFDEHWYADANGVIWRVVAPDFPFRGIFLRVSSGDAGT